MKILHSIEIKKFRSIKSIGRELSVSDLNIIVGQNDNGKSNILKALNLFFNKETDPGSAFRFDDDYCYHANSGTGTRREIRIDLIIDPPAHRFKNAKRLRWRKQWKQDGSIIESRIFWDDGSEISRSDNVYKWLDKIKYRYVPAVKGKDYFNSLMGELYDVLSEAHGDVLQNQGGGLIGGIQEVTKEITENLNAQIGVPNTIQVPSDFKLLFSNLDFGAKIQDKTYHLKQRGDGIKVRHIPVILKYMADQTRNISIPGYVKPDTIWGFEEPENNLEMKYAFEMAKAFLGYSNDIQILITTHSPAFYSLDAGGDKVSKFCVQMGDDKCTSIKKISSISEDDIDEKMGLLPLITPYLEQIYEKQKEVEGLKRRLDSISPEVKCCVITEDKNNGALRVLLEANGFNMDDVDVVSYLGKDQISGALVLGNYLKERNEELHILIHRDRDYLNDEEVEKLRLRVEKKGMGFFVTNGVDVENHFISVAHIKEIAPLLDESEISEMIDAATNESQEDSISKAVDHYFSQNKPENGAYAKKFREITEAYAANVVRYRYGKKVAGLLRAKIQKRTKENIQIFVESEAIKTGFLTKFSENIWG